ncbi:MAG: Fe-S cluster protein [Peptococcaceae bacterium BRH_c4b]|nr:MAG: Fe-S cluster protein [Peptococcaceae bacterium BRH_c4b]
MSQLNNPLAIYKLLNKSNCRQCELATCMAFAAAVIKGQKHLGDCPHLERNVIEQFDGKIVKQMNLEQQLEHTLEQLKRKIATIDFSLSAERLGATFSGDKLTIKCLGKDFTVDSEGNIISECHVNIWVVIPLLNYIISSAGNNVSGKWVPFRELKNGMRLNPLFEQRCEKPLKQVADTYPNLFEDMIYIFSGKPVVNSFSSDISLVLHPLPKVPMLIRYDKPENELESKLKIFFDTTAEDNLNIESIYFLSVGIVTMFEKITIRHGKLG